MKVTDLDRVLSLAEGDTLVVDGRVWLRIGGDEFRVHNEGTEPYHVGSNTQYVPRKQADRSDCEQSQAD